MKYKYVMWIFSILREEHFVDRIDYLNNSQVVIGVRK